MVAMAFGINGEKTDGNAFTGDCASYGVAWNKIRTRASALADACLTRGPFVSIVLVRWCCSHGKGMRPESLTAKRCSSTTIPAVGRRTAPKPKGIAMPNRIVRHGILSSRRLAGLSASARWTFLGIILQADDFGRLEADPVVLRSQIWPLDLDTHIKQDEFDRWLGNITQSGLVLRYEVDGKPYMYVRNFRNKPRASQSRFPPPPTPIPEHAQRMDACAAHVPLTGTGTVTGTSTGTVTVTGTVTPGGSDKQDEICGYCGATEQQVGFRHERDHFVPVSEGGTDDPENLIVVCHRCNQAKGSRVFANIEECRQWLHNAYWSGRRKRWDDHRKYAFGGKPPSEATQAAVPPPGTDSDEPFSGGPMPESWDQDVGVLETFHPNGSVEMYANATNEERRKIDDALTAYFKARGQTWVHHGTRRKAFEMAFDRGGGHGVDRVVKALAKLQAEGRPPADLGFAINAMAKAKDKTDDAAQTSRVRSGKGKYGQVAKRV